MFGKLKSKVLSAGRSEWTSERGFVLATIAGAVGLGNIWRFPYIVGENGGGSFVLAYIVAILLLGIPMMVLEISAGKTGHGSPVRTFRLLNKRAAPFGWFVVFLTTVIMSYYLAVTGWTLGYAVESFFGSIKTFADFTNSYMPLLYFLIVVVFTAYVVQRGVKAIEFLSKILMPLLILIVLFLAVYSLTLKNAGEAISFLFTPEFSALSNINVWILAFGQAFYSLSVGQGFLITYGSYLPSKINLPRAAGVVALVETSIAILAGVIIFPIVFSFGLDPQEGTQLAFTTLPLVFNSFAFGKYLAIMFFTLFFLAAISSCIAGMEVIKTAVKEEFNFSSKKSTFIAFLPIVPLGFLSALSFTPMGFKVFGRPFLEILDLFAANQLVVASALIGGAIISWSFSKKDLAASFGTKWIKVSEFAIGVFRALPFVGAIILLLSFIL
ncbi:MAG TPA: sodium-dependent transporter [Patescibacteria group bacterium]|nr:sodium-dependent transporter [Patescibacteria group bacterium]